MSYQEFSTLPEWTAARWSADKKLLNGADPFKWGGDNAPPAIGSEIQVTMNGLGRATVKGYFAEEGWLGLLCQFHNPPAWYLKQNKGNPPGHVFGIEWKPIPSLKGETA